MAVSESLYSVTQNFLSPDMIQKFSNQIQQPVDKTTSSLKSIIPTVLMGIVNKGSTKEGAETLVTLASKQGPTLSPDAINPTQSNEVVNGVFGNNVNAVVSKLGPSTGLNSGSITKILGMLTPMVLGVIGTKIKNENLNASGLMNFLNQQKSSLTAMLPSGLLGGFSTNTTTSDTTKNSVIGSTIRTNSSDNVIHDPFKAKKSWALYGILGIAALAIIWWLVARYNRPDVVPTTVNNQITTPVSTTEPIPTLSELSGFMSMTTGDLTKRFRFENLNFDTATTKLISGSEVELNQIADTMKKYPAATVRIEGFTDNVGAPESNLTLSADRAMEVKNQLSVRGIDTNRISVKGLGSSSPIATNSTEEGRAQNRRIEIIVKRQ